MANPVWSTIAGNIGIIAETEPFAFNLIATAPAGTTISYALNAGQLPLGVALTSTGTLSGIPILTQSTAGASRTTISKFAIRATSITGEVADQTFTITVVGQYAPRLVERSQLIASTYDGAWFEHQFNAVDFNNDTITWQISGGKLPPGIILNTATGIISGYVAVIPAHQTYTFSILVTDQKDHDVQTYTLNVLAKAGITTSDTAHTIDSILPLLSADTQTQHMPVMLYRNTTLTPLYNITTDNFFYGGNAATTAITVDTTLITAAGTFVAPDTLASSVNTLITIDNTLITADATILYNSVTNYDIGSFITDNYIAYQVNAVDFDNQLITFVISGALPPGLTLDPVTGWIYGYIPVQAIFEQTFTFSIHVEKTNFSSYISPIVTFTITIVNDASLLVQWVSPTNIGTILNGSVSELGIVATSPTRILQYRLDAGSKLPNGLRLLREGTIAGTPTFNGFTIDSSTTTFDNNTTSVDTGYNFSVTVFDSTGQLSLSKSFVLYVKHTNAAPYENLYLRVFPTPKQKTVISSILSDTILPSNKLYRPTDPNFGKSADLRLLLANGLAASAASDYIAVMVTNHYRKAMPFGQIKTAQALREGKVIYEVVYIDVVDQLANSTRRVVAIPSTPSRPGVTALYPNSLNNMRTALINAITQSNANTLPLWMTSRQLDGTQLGVTYGVVLAYTLPNESTQIAFDLTRQFGAEIQSISFDNDRYVWDNNLSSAYNIATNQFNTRITTTFDVATTQTSFDGGNTYFINNAAYYAPLSLNDHYLAFPILDHGL